MSPRPRWILPLALTVATTAGLAMPGEARADNPAVWDFTVMTTGNDASWTSDTAVDLGYPQYEVSYEITQLDLATILGTESLLDTLDEEDRSGTRLIGSLPEALAGETASAFGNTATISVGINEFGYGYASFTDVTLSALVQSVSLGGTITVTALPEPASAALLAMGGVALAVRRRRSV